MDVSLDSGAMVYTSSSRFLNLRLHVLNLSGSDVPVSNLIVSWGGGVYATLGEFPTFSG